jgi:hypothetical protein
MLFNGHADGADSLFLHLVCIAQPNVARDFLLDLLPEYKTNVADS